jgi:hypothetical protein
MLSLVWFLSLLLLYQVLEGAVVLILNWVHPINNVPVYFLCARWRRQRARVNEAILSARNVHECSVVEFV